MALKNLSTEEMVTLSLPLCTKGTPQRKALEAQPDLALPMRKLDEAHAELLATQAQPASPQLATLQAKADALDAQHDWDAKAIDGVLTGFSLAERSADEAAQLQRLHQVLLPDGLCITQRSYRDEAGAAKLLEQRLTPEHRALLKKLPLPHKRTLLQVVEDWLSTAAQLGKVEDQKVTEGQAPQTSASDAVRARNQWIRAVSALESSAELIELDATTMNLLLGAIRNAEQGAQRRAGRKGTTTEPVAPPPQAPAKPAAS